uniref:sensor histidine kinase n=1 Tax=uncultured Draconibacterium sp. TaxID=1573823 RepID=UPI0032168BCD
MKQLLIILISILFGINTLQAQEKNPYEETTWNVIRERLFSGKNTNVFRYEKDIRFQLQGVKTQQDSSIFIEMIAELNELLETVEINLVNNNPNFVLKIVSENGSSMNQRQYYSGSAITNTKLELGFTDISNQKQVKKYSYYHVCRNLTKLFAPRHGHSEYGGIFDSPKSEDSEFHEIDKELLRKIYSQDFYKQFKKNTIQQRGSWYYLNLRYGKSIKSFILIFSLIISILTFFIFLSKESQAKSLYSFKSYFKKGTIIIFIFSLVYSLNRLPSINSAFGVVFTVPDMIENFIKMFLYGLLALPAMFILERKLLPSTTNFARKQIIIFSITVFFVFLGFILFSFLLIYTWAFNKINFGEFIQNTQFLTFIYLIFIAGIRIFYNFINYYLQSMVNKKDVELAKMKELKNQAELNALHSRINPHFLYNSLNSIASLAHINPEKTENMATALSELFRYSINKENKTYVTVAEELEMVKKYLEIEKTRFEDKLDYKIEVQDNIKEKLIPKFLIQPLAENAIKHGLSKIKGVGKMIVKVKRHQNDLVITIFDNGPDFPEEPVSGYGLQNLNDKLEIIYGSNAYINWENGENKHFKITIKNQFKG